jgi:hypothetical protein
VELGRKASDIGYLLSNKNALPAPFRFIVATRQFEKTHRKLEMEAEQDNDDGMET